MTRFVAAAFVCLLALAGIASAGEECSHGVHAPTPTTPEPPRTIRPKAAPDRLPWCEVDSPDFVDALVGERLSYRIDRPTTAYRATSGGVLAIQPNEAVFRNVAITSITDGRYLLDGAGSGVAVRPECRNSRFMFGVGENGGLFRSPDGQNWTRIGSPVVSNLFALHDDALLRTERIGDRLAVFRSEDDGLNWQRAKWEGTGQDFAWLTPGAWLVHWGFHQAANGTLAMAEYKLPDNTRYIYRSGDGGRTWSLAHDIGGVNDIRHYHAVTKHEGLGRWIAITGDGLAQQTVLASDDDARTWYRYTQLGEVFLQPTALLDVGDPTRLLLGSDLYWQVGWVDVSDGAEARQVRSLITNWHWLPGSGYCYDLFEHDGVYFAPQYDNRNVWTKNVVLSVSNDLEHWAVYHRFTGSERGVLSYAGWAGDRHHMTVAPTLGFTRAFAVAQPEIVVRPGLAVAGASVNLAASTDSAADLALWSDLSPAAPGTGARGNLEYTTAVAHSGDGCVRAWRTDGQPLEVQTPLFAFEPGKTYQARLWLRGEGADVSVRWTRNNVASGEGYMFGVSDQWREVILPGIQPHPTATSMGLSVRIWSTQFNRCEVYLDSIQIQQTPSTPWLAPGSGQADALVEATVLNTPAWTNVFVFEPDNASLAVPSGVHPIKTYRFSAQDYVTIFFDAASSRFGLQAFDRGRPLPVAYSEPQNFLERAQLKFALRRSGPCLSLAISNGQPLEDIPADGPRDFGASTVSIRFGDADGRRIFPGAVVNDLLYSGFLSRAAVLDAMNELNPDPAPVDLSADGKCDLDDLILWLGHFGTPLADVDGDGVGDLSDLLSMLGSLGTAQP
jgi:hypothetical protein